MYAIAGFGEDDATKRAIAASLRDQQEHEERMQRRQGGAEAKLCEMLGANGTPAAPPGAALGWAHLICKHGMQCSLIADHYMPASVTPQFFGCLIWTA